MKKSLIALAVLASAAGAASAQSSVTLFGIVDAGIQVGRGEGAGSSDRVQLASGGYSTSRLGFRGTEDLGGGMSASFWLEAGLNADNGTGQGTNTNNQASGGSGGFAFGRRSTVSLAGGWGELRLGRDYTPQFWNLAVFDPFGTVGVGAAQTLGSIITGATAVRASNTIGYFLPGKLGGFYGQFQYYMGENAQNGAATEDDGTGMGLRIGFANGPFNVAFATSRTEYAAGDVRQSNIGGQWDFGIARAMAQYTRDENGAIDGKGWLLGGLFPVGAGEIRASYSRYEADSVGNPESKKLALGYVHNLSKRTAVYTTYARVKNSGGAASAVGGAVTAPNNNSSGFDLGLRHSF
ncbi:MAG: porin [Ramlibacter sp.]